MTKFGATGEFPEGKLTDDDEGALVLGVAIYKGKVFVNFGKPVEWLGLGPGAAVEFGVALLKAAASIAPPEKSNE